MNYLNKKLKHPQRIFLKKNKFLSIKELTKLKIKKRKKE
jgi:hypothetical protein